MFLAVLHQELWGKNISPNLTNSRKQPHVFGPLEPRLIEKNTSSQSRSRLEKKSGAGATRKFLGASALLITSLALPHFTFIEIMHPLQYKIESSLDQYNLLDHMLFVKKSYFILSQMAQFCQNKLNTLKMLTFKVRYFRPN